MAVVFQKKSRKNPQIQVVARGCSRRDGTAAVGKSPEQPTAVLIIPLKDTVAYAGTRKNNFPHNSQYNSPKLKRRCLCHATFRK